MLHTANQFLFSYNLHALQIIYHSFNLYFFLSVKIVGYIVYLQIDFSNIKSEISSQESWNLSDLSEYDDIEVNSDEDQQTTTCARTAVYNAVKR